MYKLLVTDVDGTLVTRDGRISPQNLDALREAWNSGIHVSICTGRSMLSSTHHIDEIGLDGYHAFYDGAFICHRTSEDVLHAATIEPAHVRKLVEFAGEQDIYLELSTGLRSYSAREVLVPEFKTWVFAAEHFTGEMDGIWEKEQIVQGQLVTNCEEENSRVADLKTELGDEIQIIKAQIPPFPGMTFWVVLANGISKGNAVEKLAAHHGISTDEVMAIGDWQNDIPLLEMAGLGVAMGNATDDVKAVAQYVTKTVDEHGLAEAVRKFLLS